MCVFKNSIQVYKKKMLIIFIIKEKLGCHNLCVLYFSLGNVHIELLVLFVSCNVLLTKNTVQCSVSNVHNELRNILQFRKIYVTSWNTYSHWVRVSEFLNLQIEFFLGVLKVLQTTARCKYMRRIHERFCFEVGDLKHW